MAAMPPIVPMPILLTNLRNPLRFRGFSISLNGDLGTCDSYANYLTLPRSRPDPKRRPG